MSTSRRRAASKRRRERAAALFASDTGVNGQNNTAAPVKTGAHCPATSHRGIVRSRLAPGLRKTESDRTLPLVCRSIHPQMARDAVAGADFDEFRHLDLAARLGIGAARVKRAAGRRIDRARHVALQQPLGALQLRVRHRHRRQQRLGIGVLRVREQRRLSAYSTILPRYMTAMRWLMCSTTARSCAMNR